MLNDRDSILSALREKALKVRELRIDLRNELRVQGIHEARPLTGVGGEKRPFAGGIHQVHTPGDLGRRRRDCHLVVCDGTAGMCSRANAEDANHTHGGYEEGKRDAQRQESRRGSLGEAPHRLR